MCVLVSFVPIFSGRQSTPSSLTVPLSFSCAGKGRLPVLCFGVFDDPLTAVLANGFVAAARTLDIFIVLFGSCLVFSVSSQTFCTYGLFVEPIDVMSKRTKGRVE